MKSVVIHAEGNVCVEERPIPTLQTENDVLVKVVSSGLCGSDIPRIFAKGAHYYPITLGHEFSGYVESYGAAVTDLQPGDAVACVPLLPCFQCPQCQREYFSLCKQYQFVGSRSEGGNAEYVVVKRANLFRLPDQMPIDDGAFIEPITVGLHAFHLAQGCEGKNVIIIGAGTIGLLALQCARELGANSVTAIDINPQKLELAKTLGATHVFNSREMSGQAIQQAQLALVGTLHHDLTLPAATFGQILRKELNIVGSWMNYSGPWPGEEWQTATRLLTEKRLQLAPLIAHRGDAESFARAVQALNGAPMQGKILLKLS
ncbi:alcohol dehydrogenase catalytic domain-containing protein [Klebsiella pneumoniae]|nr:alcohol dehydrogenase catalytic domain-containing protein [Klebsiella pneumoniae]MDH8327350.1 alcohol dehydrogenase catalytic domain-containing protein [Klebsiella pneumoniae]HBX8236920.1 zinc-binding dehydrogenase [Klebsiella pneumoniae]